MGLERKCVTAIEPLLRPSMTEDDLQDLILLYLECSKSYTGKRLRYVMGLRAARHWKEKQRSEWLNRSPRNIPLDHSYRDGGALFAERLNLEPYLERQR